jgi:hypothetical protein
MSRLVLVAPLQPGAKERARALLAAGPPYDLEHTRFDRHHVFLSDREAVFVFEAPGAAATLEVPAEDPVLWNAAAAWSECLAERPRVAAPAFAWERAVAVEGVFFGPTPGPGDSEGGDLY